MAALARHLAQQADVPPPAQEFGVAASAGSSLDSPLTVKNLKLLQHLRGRGRRAAGSFSKRTFWHPARTPQQRPTFVLSQWLKPLPV